MFSSSNDEAACVQFTNQVENVRTSMPTVIHDLEV
jgi:hypothetical protein